MRAAWYERTGPAAAVLEVGEIPAPVPGPGEVRIRVAVSGINPGDIKKRLGWTGAPMPYPRVIPHSDGAGVIDAVGPGVPESRTGERVWCYGAQSARPFGTAAEYVCLPGALAVVAPGGVDLAQGACLGIPGITAHRAVTADGPVAGKTVLVAGGAGGVGRAAVALARREGASVIASVPSTSEVGDAARAGAAQVIDLSRQGLAETVRALTGGRGVDRVIEVAFAANVAADAQILVEGGVLAAYSTDQPEPTIPFWPMLFNNLVIRLLGSDGFPPEAKAAAAEAVTAAAAAGDLVYPIGARFPLERIAEAHEWVEHPTGPGRVVVDLTAPG